MSKLYHHLSYCDRLLIKQMLDNGCPVKKIAEELNVNISTIYRELNRSKISDKYDPELVQRNYLQQLQAKGRIPKLELDNSLAHYISKLLLEEFLSPSEVIKRLNNEGHKNIPSINTIYSAIDKGLIPSVTRETLLLKRKTTHMFSNGLIKVPRWICIELDLHDKEDLNIDIDNGKIIIKKSKKTFYKKHKHSPNSN